MFCLEPLILAGYLFMARPGRLNGSELNGASVEVQSCERGLGASFKAVQSGVYSGAVQYGYQIPVGDFTLTILPKFGLGYVDVIVYEQTSKANFYLENQFLLGYDKYYVGTSFSHMSNGGLGDRNGALDMISVSAGFKF